MKVVVIILIMCAAQTSASFFEEFRGAMHSVQHSFGRLLTDVYTDVSQTIGCTLLAVKQVLALDQAFHESSDYNRRCRGQAPIVSPEIPRTDKENLAYRYIDSINANQELDNIEMKFKTETDRLVAISTLLKREVDNIPKDLKLKFQFESEPQEPIGSIWQSLKILHDVEHSNKNYVRASKIHEVLDKAINIMNIKTTDTNESDDDKIKTIVKDLETKSKDTLIKADDQFEEWKKEELKENKETDSKISTIVLEKDSQEVLTKANDQFKEWKGEEFKQKIDSEISTFVNDLEKNTKEALSKADEQFKEWKEDESKEIEEIESVIKNDQQKNDSLSLINTKDDIYTKMNNIDFSKEEDKIDTSTSAPLVTMTTISPELESFQNLILSQFGPKDIASKNAAVDEAKKLIQDSEYRNKVFDSLAKADSASTDLFENPDLFVNNFG